MGLIYKGHPIQGVPLTLKDLDYNENLNAKEVIDNQRTDINNNSNRLNILEEKHHIVLMNTINDNQNDSYNLTYKKWDNGYIDIVGTITLKAENGTSPQARSTTLRYKDIFKFTKTPICIGTAISSDIETDYIIKINPKIDEENIIFYVYSPGSKLLNSKDVIINFMISGEDTLITG